MAVDPKHRYSDEAERADEDIDDDFKLKKILCSTRFILTDFSAFRVNVPVMLCETAIIVI